MVLCLVALPIFALLSIFSVRYRRLTLEAVDCLLRTVTLRKCRSGLDERIRASISGKLLKIWPGAARFTYRYYKALSWIIFILFTWSLVVSAAGIVNYVKYGNFNGPASTGFCLFDPTGSQSAICEADIDIPQQTVTPAPGEGGLLIGAPDAQLTIIEFGCYTCPHTRQAQSTIEQVLEQYRGKVNLEFHPFVLSRHDFSGPAAHAAYCADEQDKKETFHELMLNNPEVISQDNIDALAAKAGLDTARFDECMVSGRYDAEVDADALLGVRAGVQGTPTFFIGDQRIVGPKPLKTFEVIIDPLLR